MVIWRGVGPRHSSPWLIREPTLPATVFLCSGLEACHPKGERDMVHEAWASGIQ
jgi:hypothetical protein